MMSMLMMDGDVSADDKWWCQCWWWMMMSVLMMDDDASADDGWWCQCWWWMVMSVLMMDDDVSADDGWWWCYAGICWYVGMLACWFMLLCWYRLERLNSIIFTIYLIPLRFVYTKYLCFYCLYLLLVCVIFSCFPFILWIPLWIYVHNK